VQLFAAHRTYHEGQLTKRKDGLVANRRLAERALALGLDRHLRLLPFSVPGWLDPEPLRVSAGRHGMWAFKSAEPVAAPNAGQVARAVPALVFVPCHWRQR
jgi:hypothetical protein